MNAGNLIPKASIITVQGGGVCPSCLTNVARVLVVTNGDYRTWLSAHFVNGKYYRHECPGKAKAA